MMCTVRVSLLVIACLIIHSSWANQCDPSWISNRKVDQADLLSKYYRAPRDTKADENKNSLKLVHVVFRHGDRTAEYDASYPMDPYHNYSYYPVGFGQLTNLGKKQEYDIGVALRKRYNEFLGDIFTPEVVEAVSTDYDRTKSSLYLALAGLYTPVKEQIWNQDLLWQPIATHYKPTSEDVLLEDPIRVCPYYTKLFEEYLVSEEHLNENAKLKSFYDYVSANTGLNVTQPEQIYNIFFTLYAQEKWGLELPAWTKCVWPDKMTEVAIKHYYVFSKTPEMKAFTGGRVFEKIISDSKDLIDNKLKPEGRKIFLYSSHERNVAFMLIGLDVFYPHVPPYASYVTIELHEINGVYGIKAYYQNYSEDEPILLTIPGCDSFCPFDKFLTLMDSTLPKKPCRV